MLKYLNQPKPAQTGPNRPRLHSLSVHPYFIATALDSVQNLQRLLKGQQQQYPYRTDQDIHKKLEELQTSLQVVKQQASSLDRLKC